MYLNRKEKLPKKKSRQSNHCCQIFYKTKKVYPIADALVSNVVYKDKDYTNKNLGNHSYACASSWTYQGIKGDTRSLLLFQTDSIPLNIISAKLNLFGAGHDPLTKSNACYILRVISRWDEKSITWNTQPKISRLSKKTIRESNSAYQNYIVDITSWVKRWKSTLIGYGLQNYGIMIKLQNENYYTKMQFGSGKYSNSNKRPYLLIGYKTIAGNA